MIRTYVECDNAGCTKRVLLTESLANTFNKFDRWVEVPEESKWLVNSEGKNFCSGWCADGRDVVLSG